MFANRQSCSYTIFAISIKANNYKKQIMATNKITLVTGGRGACILNLLLIMYGSNPINKASILLEALLINMRQVNDGWL